MRVLIVLCAALLTGGCGPAGSPVWVLSSGSGPGDPDHVDSAAVVRRIPTNVVSIHARRLPDRDIPSLAVLTNLQNLHFSRGFAAFQAKISDTGLARLASLNLPNLRYVDLGFCGNITDGGLGHLAKINQLTGLSITACPRITEAGLKTLLTMTNLTLIDLKRCRQFTDSSLDLLATKTNWQTIVLGGTTGATSNGIARLQAKLPNAQIENDQNWEQTSGRYRR